MVDYYSSRSPSLCSLSTSTSIKILCPWRRLSPLSSSTLTSRPFTKPPPRCARLLRMGYYRWRNSPIWQNAVAAGQSYVQRNVLLISLISSIIFFKLERAAWRTHTNHSSQASLQCFKFICHPETTSRRVPLATLTMVSQNAPLSDWHWRNFNHRETTSTHQAFTFPVRLPLMSCLF